jgi:hypothetical protein
MNEIKYPNFPFWKLLEKSKEWDKLIKENPTGFILWVPNRGKYKCLPYNQWEATAFINNWSIVRIDK